MSEDTESKQNMSKPIVSSSPEQEAAAYEISRAKNINHETAKRDANKPAGSENRTQSSGKVPQYEDKTVREMHKNAAGEGAPTEHKRKESDVTQAVRNTRDEDTSDKDTKKK